MPWRRDTPTRRTGAHSEIAVPAPRLIFARQSCHVRKSRGLGAHKSTRLHEPVRSVQRGECSNLAVQHRPHRDESDLRPTLTTSIDPCAAAHTEEVGLDLRSTNRPRTTSPRRVTFRSMKLITRLLTRYWGYLAVVLAVAGFFLHGIGLAVVIVLALAGLGYFLFQAPMWCGAETRKNQWCRNNSHGLLLGCHLRQHKLQRVKQTLPRPEGERLLGRASPLAAD
jgi:hypothetical protein